MSITGAVAPGGHDLVLTRTVPVARSLIWDHLADPELLATWYGTYAGDPAMGRVEVTMTAEPGATEAEEFTIHACETGRLLSVSSAVGEETWRLSVELADADAAGAPPPASPCATTTCPPRCWRTSAPAGSGTWTA
ncbi:hypothetical protein [Brachybacterium sp. UNK5269]|uniref:hypothetical protein n=1 Tax=Brachybacterium sp. UNK5269 TaxID=3408576 RepID=UPI003BAF79AA